MDDAALAAAAASGDRDAWAAIYDRYADKLHDFCWSVLRDHHEAADALHDAFVAAAERIDQLRDPSKLRPWLYSVCRTTCLAKARRRARVVPTAEVGEMTPATFDDVTGGAEGAELRALVWDAAGGLSTADRALLHLHLRHGLDGADLGAALGTSAHHATVRLSRVRALVERSLGALLVGRVGRQDCPLLDALLAGWDGSLNPLLRKRVARHIDECETCSTRKRAMVSPLALLAAVPMVPAPAGLRDRVLDDIQLVSSTGDLGGRMGRRRIAAAIVVVVGVMGGALLSDAVTTDDTRRTGATITSTSTSTSTPTTLPAVPSTLAGPAPPAPVGTPAATRPRPPATTTTSPTTSTRPTRTTTTTAPPTGPR